MCSRNINSTLTLRNDDDKLFLVAKEKEYNFRTETLPWTELQNLSLPWPENKEIKQCYCFGGSNRKNSSSTSS
ncbi:hypothetical protein Mapa_003240 [Marchantia paleacea]|nr:hypothetical protein Mapa_003240 [Marchantia paleacea]